MVQKFFVWRAELRIAFFIDLRCYVVQWLFQFGMVGALYFNGWIMWWQGIYPKSVIRVYGRLVFVSSRLAASLAKT